jgi:hypothetical protein
LASACPEMLCLFRTVAVGIRAGQSDSKIPD